VLRSNLLTTREAASYLRLSESFLHKLRVRGGGPRFARLGNRVFYRPADLDEWLEAHLQSSTSETAKPGSTQQDKLRVPGRKRRLTSAAALGCE
jgi:excisionase family DNA binding protein